EPATAKSDQYSYCATVHEMLTGSRPGDVEATRKTDSVLAPWIARALRRGLSRDPAERFPSMHELVAALADDPRVRRRRRLLLAGVAVAALATGAIVVRLGSSSGPSCDIAATALGDAWTPERAQQVMRALSATSANDFASRATETLDIYAKAWLEERRDACAATHERGEQSQVALDRRVACLDRARRSLGELTKLLASADAKLAAHAGDAIGQLRDPATCTGDDTELPTDAVGRVIVEEGRTLLDRASALQWAGRLDDSERAAGQVAALVATRDVPRLGAEALLIQARVNIDRDKQDAVEEQLWQALLAAERGKDDRLVAEIWIELVMATGAQKHRFDLALSHVRAAEAAIARVDSPDLQIRFGYSLGTLLLAQGKVDDARKRIEHALVLAGDDPRRIGQRGLLRATLCDVERQSGKLAAAHEQCKQALELLEKAFGSDHMRVAVTLNTLGGVAFAEHDWATAETTYKRVIDQLERRNLRNQVNYALALSNLGAVYSSRDDIAPARTYFERALASFDANHPKHPQRLLPLQGLASIALRTGDTRTAVERYEQVRTAMAATYAPEHPALLVADYNLALAYVGNKQPAKAKP
ncbi:MAG TPA: tetratricopeptide repeat protein, partial [Kofleriaceae bacterium]